MNKVENSESDDEPRITFDYFKIIKLFLNAHLELNFKIHNYFSNLKHDCFFSANLKHVYLIISFHFNNRHYFAFIISEINQIQFIRM